MQNILPAQTSNMCIKLLIGTALAVYLIKRAYIGYSSNFTAEDKKADSTVVSSNNSKSEKLEKDPKRDPERNPEPDWESMNFKEYTETLLATL